MQVMGSCGSFQNATVSLLNMSIRFCHLSPSVEPCYKKPDVHL